MTEQHHAALQGVQLAGLTSAPVINAVIRNHRAVCCAIADRRVEFWHLMADFDQLRDHLPTEEEFELLKLSLQHTIACLQLGAIDATKVAENTHPDDLERWAEDEDT